MACRRVCGYAMMMQLDSSQLLSERPSTRHREASSSSGVTTVLRSLSSSSLAGWAGPECFATVALLSELQRQVLIEMHAMQASQLN